MTMTDNATHGPNYPHQINGAKTMTQPTPALRCHDAEACGLGQWQCPSPEASGCAPQPQALHLPALLRDRLGANAAADLLDQQHARIAELESGHNYNIRVIDAYRAQVNALEAQLSAIGAVAACFGADWPDVEGEPEVLRRVKWAARQLKAAPEYAPLTDERIQEIDDETHFHESPDWPRRFARGIEAEARKKPTQ
ncbi:hypothetical protein N0K08_20620 [Acidovorax sp. Be4]|uniref:Uncharacterized protein n=1 Tax=Acidovorax bellezanensis TaxID=2976702 RepID=A0ABT2PRF6_9BURK|nr:hypothetical protein [Acidovorax sp. Be4]MCT9813039.1 hypothetical protein [Acidovorax sp. Be4]